MASYKKRAIPQASRRALAIRYGCQPGSSIPASCSYCGFVGKIVWHRLRDGKPSAWVTFWYLEIDHVRPEYMGGTARPENLTLACQPCNRSKGARTAAEWRGRNDRRRNNGRR